MQKKKKVSKSKTQPVKKASAKSAKATPVAKKAAKKPVEKKVTPKAVAEPKAEKKATKVKAEPKEAPVVESNSSITPISKEDFKNMSADAQEHYKKWLKLHKQLSVEKPIEYRMTEDFEIKAPISHKVHGWGVVMQKRDNYIDVLFEAGLKTLIVNYKP